MKRIKRALANARSAMSVKTHKHPRLFVILAMLAMNLVILVIAAFVAMAIDENYNNFIDAFAHGSVTWMLTPNAILEIESAQTLFLAVLVLIVGLVLFTGTIIALTTNAIRDYFDKKKTASGKVYLNRHIVILNWNAKVPELVADLVHVQSRRVTVLVLADMEKQHAERAIRNALRKKKKATFQNLAILVKRGDPLAKSELEDSSLESADAVIIMSPARVRSMTSAEGLGKSDLNVIKIILTLSHLDIGPDVPIITEVRRNETKEKILTINRKVERLKDHRLIPVCFDRRLGQIMAQTVVEEDIEDVYLSLFSFEGAEIYHLAGVSFAECLQRHTHAIPIELLEDGLYVLSSDNAAKDIRKDDAAIESTALAVEPFDERVFREVFIIGDNNKRSFIEESFRAFERLHGSEFQASLVQEKELDALIDELNESEKEATLLLLSDDTAEEDALDANVTDNLLRIESRLKRENVRIIVELLDPKNDSLIKNFNIENTIISNRIVSLLLSKLALFPKTEKFYEDLLSVEPHESNKDDEAIVIAEASRIIKADFPLTFANVKSFIVSLYESQERTAVCIGRIREDVLDIFLGDLHAEEMTIDETDRLIFLKLPVHDD